MTCDIDTLANELTNDLKKVSNWEFQWKMSFHRVLSKRTQEAIFSQKLILWSLTMLIFPNVNLKNNQLSYCIQS